MPTLSRPFNRYAIVSSLAGRLRAVALAWFRASAVLLLALASTSHAWAGPPFLTDDPEPVDYRHWEVYLATQIIHERDGSGGTAPHVEINYGVVPNVQLHLIVPVAWSRRPGGPTLMGPGDVELGIKYRFVRETAGRPQIGTFVQLEIPVGDPSRDLGTEHVRVFLPIWLQKSFGPWTTYGGGGYWVNPGPDAKNYWFCGWEGQREISKSLTLGAEVYHMTSPVVGGSSRTGFNVGGQWNFSDEHHLLFSAGRGLGPQNQFSAYLAFQWTLGPVGKEEGSHGRPPILLTAPLHPGGTWSPP